MTERTLADLGALAAAVEEADERLRMAVADRNEKRKKLAAWLRTNRLANGESYRALAKRLGCTAATLHDIEYGRRWSNNIVFTWIATP